MNQGDPQVWTFKVKLVNSPKNLQEGTAMGGTGLTEKPSVEAVTFHVAEGSQTYSKGLDFVYC